MSFCQSVCRTFKSCGVECSIEERSYSGPGKHKINSTGLDEGHCPYVAMRLYLVLITKSR